jgi:phage/conjugal plasmid C-4 type zinc finger TraR family protein
MAPLDEHQFDQAQHLEEEERAARVAEQRERSPARQQLEVGGQVVCRSCYEPIAAARLEAMPDTALCVECQQLYERYGI